MLSIFKYLKKHAGFVAVIIALLAVQAYCDLALPRYTSDIVDVGLQQGGIERAAPDRLRAETLEALSLFLSEEDETVLRTCYAWEGDGLYTLTVGDETSLDQLEDILSLPLAAI